MSFFHEYWVRMYLLAGGTAFALALLLTPASVFALHRLGMVDHAAAGKLHKRPVPRGGGIVIFVAFAVGVLLPNYRDNPMKGVLLGSGICLLTGALDDFRGGIPATLKFLILVSVTLIMSRYGVMLKVFQVYPLDLLLTILWVVGVTSAFNGMDNMDGLASGLAAVTSAMYLVIALQAFWLVRTENSLSWFGLLAAGLVGANLGFLVYNFHPARVFMGDAGSFFLGFTLAALGVMGEWSENRLMACAIPVLILGVPVFDFIYIVAARIIRGQTRTIRQVINHCALDHLSHRLLWIGFTQRKAVLFIYLISATMGVAAIVIGNSTSLFDMFFALAQGVAIIVIVMVLMSAATRRGRAPDTDGDAAEALVGGGPGPRKNQKKGD